MQLVEQWLTVDGTRTWASRPAVLESKLPTVLLIQEAWGVDTHIRDVAGRLATSGYAVLAPDLLAGGTQRPNNVSEPRVDEVKAFLDTMPPGGWANPETRRQALEALPAEQAARVEETMDLVFSQMRASDRYLATLRAAVDLTGDVPVASVGFCMGGGLSALLATREPRLRSAVIFYGSAPPEEAVPEINCPVLGHYGANDDHITSQVPAFAEAMKRAGKSFEHHIHPDAPHAFFNDTRRSYRVDAARASWASTLAFFGQTLAT